jgi:phage recombination protein Bet
VSARLSAAHSTPSAKRVPATKAARPAKTGAKRSSAAPPAASPGATANDAAAASSTPSAANAIRQSLVARMAERFGIAPESILATLRATAFKLSCGEVSHEQMMALLAVADQYGLNPFTREIFALQDRGDIVPVVGVDGWSRIINTHPEFDGLEFAQDEASCTCIIYRKDRSHAVKVTEYLGECRRENVAPWQSHPRRMLRHKALIQCARLAFGFAGIYDPDEAERIVCERALAGAHNTRVTPQSAAQANQPAGYTAFEAETLPLMQLKAAEGAAQLAAAFNALPPSPLKKAFWTRHGAALKMLAVQP